MCIGGKGQWEVRERTGNHVYLNNDSPIAILTLCRNGNGKEKNLRNNPGNYILFQLRVIDENDPTSHILPLHILQITYYKLNWFLQQIREIKI